MTAQRLVQRMKKDSIHSGRRPSGLCGAALLLAARMHEFSRTPNDIVRIVKIHESTLRKRLVEFGETPSSALTLDEFMSVDLEAEQDPPAFKAARKKDKERLQKLEESTTEFNQLQAEIDAALDRDLHKSMSRKRKFKGENLSVDEIGETDQFIKESTLEVINECLEENPDGSTKANGRKIVPEGMKPDLLAMCSHNIDRKENAKTENREDDGELNLDDLDDDEINGYIMTEEEARYKDMMWNRLHAEHLKEMKEKEERLAKEREEGKPEKKKRKSNRKKNIGPSNSAGEAIEKMLQEKKISSKINYDILKTLTDSTITTEEQEPEDQEPVPVKDESSDIDVLSRNSIKPEIVLSRASRPPVNLASFSARRKPPMTATLPVVESDSVDVKPVIDESPMTKIEHGKLRKL